MAIKFELLFILFVSFSSFLSSASSSVASDDINQWCNKTPYPEPYKYFMSNGSHNFVPKQKSKFRKVAMQIAMERALNAETHTKWFGSKCRNDLKKMHGLIV
ncbi:Pectinesterase 2 [Camellia lanceoleosa]|nr:Pectinesterase 2 [Camellia lanceoleosa]